MCLIFFALKHHPGYKFILAGNRDEFYARRTAPASFWLEAPNVVAGRDLEAGGTWLGMSKTGKICMVTNYRDLKNIRQQAPSRGHLVYDYLINDTDAGLYMAGVSQRASEYNGFNLLAGTPEKMYYLSNYKSGIESLDMGIFGLSNSLLDTPWPKVKEGKRRFAAIIKENFSADDLFEFLRDERIAPDDQLPDTGVGLERERALSAMFIKSPGYGSRCSTVILVDTDNHVIFSERVYDLTNFDFTTQTFHFTIAR